MAIYPGDDICFKRTVKDEDDVLVDPTTHNIKVYDPNKNQSGSEMTSPTKESTGIYKQFWQVPDNATIGVWRVEWVTMKGNTSKKLSERFVVEPVGN